MIPVCSCVGPLTPSSVQMFLAVNCVHENRPQGDKRQANLTAPPRGQRQNILQSVYIQEKSDVVVEDRSVELRYV